MSIVELKDGSSVEIRRMQRRDIPSLYRVMSQVFQEGKSMLTTEMPFTMQQLEREFLSASENDQVTYVAAKQDRVVAWLRADRRNVPFMRHIATLWLGMEKEVRGVGLGQKLLEEVFSWTRQQNIEKIELGVRSSNQSAIRLYQKMGFVKEGCKSKAIKTNTGYEDDIWMGLFVDEQVKKTSSTSKRGKTKSKQSSTSNTRAITAATKVSRNKTRL